MSINTLFDNEWISVREIKLPDFGIDGYAYAHESSCAGRKVVVLPFRAGVFNPESDVFLPLQGYGTDLVEVPEFVLEVLLRSEVVPCWHTREPQVCSLTGGWENGDDAACLFTALRKLYEESGYRAHPQDMISLGTAHGTKSLDTTYYLYAVDLTNAEPEGDGRGGGSPLEATASCRWVRDDTVLSCGDPHVHVAYNRLISWLMQQVAQDIKS